MAYKSFTSGSTLPAADIMTYLMNQAVITCTSTTRPSVSVPEGMFIYETDTNIFWYASVAGSPPTWLPLMTKLQYATGTSATSPSTGVAIKDGGCGDIAFQVYSTAVPYRVTYICRVATDNATTSVDIQIRDGGSSSPTNADTIIAAGSQSLDLSGGAGAKQCIAVGIGTLSVGTHTVAGFYTRTSGSGNVTVAQSTGGARILSVEMLTN